MMKDANGQFEAEGSTAGPCDAGKTSAATTILSELLSADELSAVNARWAAGATYHADGEGKVLDYIVIPESRRPD
eukprot:9100734-Pyramimonas_sp.AAC.1